MLPAANNFYRAFTDPSGGSDDSFALAISHKSEDRIIIDAIREARPPFSPDAVVDDFAALLKSYRVSRVTGDRYAGEFPRELFRKHGIAYDLAKQTKSELFRDLLPLLNSGRIVLPRNDRLQGQIVGLERRTSAVGRDTISHPDRGHDDVANAVAGAAALSKFGGYDTSMRWVSGDDDDAATPGSASVFKPSSTAGAHPTMTLSHAESGRHIAQTPVFGKCSSSVARDGSLGTAEELGEQPLALDQWQIAQLVAVLLDQIEGVQYHLAAPSSVRSVWNRLARPNTR